MCAISLGARDLALCFANKRATSLPGDGEMEYTDFGKLPNHLVVPEVSDGKHIMYYIMVIPLCT